MIDQVEAIRLKTSRLEIFPLSYSQLISYTKLNGELESTLGLNLRERTLPPELKEAFEQIIIPAVNAKPDNILFSTLWTIIYKRKCNGGLIYVTKGHQMKGVK